MWRVYDPQHIETFDEPYEAYSRSFPDLLSELGYIGIFLGRSGKMRVFAVFSSK